MNSNVIELESVRGFTPCERWHIQYTRELTKLVPYAYVAEMPNLIVPPTQEQRILQNSHIAALMTRVPSHRIMPITIRWEEHQLIERHVLSRMVPPQTVGGTYEIVLLKSTEGSQMPEDAQHFLYARSFMCSVSQVLAHYALHQDPDFGFPNVGFFSDTDEQIVTGREYIQKYMKILEEEDYQLTLQATEYIRQFGLNSENSALRVISEVIATYLCGFGFSTRHGKPEKPFKRHPMLHRLTKDFVEAHYVVSSKHD